MLQALLLFAEEGAKQPDPNQGSPLGFLPLGVLLLALFYFVVLRPQRRQDQERQNLMSNLSKNDEVLTAGGIYGTVVAVSESEDKVTIKVDDNVRMKVTKGSIQRNLTREEMARSQQEAAKAAKEKGKEGGA